MDPITFALLFCCFGIFGFLVNFIVAYWIYQDSEKLQIPDAFIWVIIGFVAPFIGLLIYIFGVRSQHTKTAQPVQRKEEKVEAVKSKGPITRN